MATYCYSPAREREPQILLVPGKPLDGSHWMHHWLGWSDRCQLVELGLWDDPHRNTWVNKLNLAIRRAERNVVVVTDDIAALALAWWVEFESVGSDSPVLGAVIVNPPNVDMPGADPRLARFGAIPRRDLPFTTFLVSDPAGSVGHHRALMRLARDWNSCPVCDETGDDWASGWKLLESVIGLLPAARLWRGDAASRASVRRALAEPWFL